MPQLSILGCGWLGQAFVRRYGDIYDINAAVRTLASYEKLVPLACKASILPENATAFYDCEVMIISLSPRHDYEDAIKKVMANMSQDTQLIFLSSTSVYKGLEGVITEDNITSNLFLSPMLKMENFILTQRHDTLILRLGGLMGADRVAGMWQNRRKTLENTAVNYLHQEDAVSVIHYCIEKNIRAKKLNVVAPEHPLRALVYEKNAEDFGFEIPEFTPGKAPVVESEFLTKSVNYKFIYPNPLMFWTK